MNSKIAVLLTTEGTYPFHQGGVSNWCDILVQNLPSVDFIIYSVLMDPFVTQKFKLPTNAQLIRMPLWGTEEPAEHLTTPFSKVFLSKKRTNEKVIRAHFLPLFKLFIQEIVRINKEPLAFAQILYQMYLYFQEYEYKVTFKSEIVWETYKSFILEYCSNNANEMTPPDVFGLIQSLGWLYRFFNILNTPVPDVQVTHSSAAAFCGIPCVLAKLKNKTPFLLTEHGVYLREQYLSLSNRNYSAYLNTFLVRFIHSITQLNYIMADQVSPVCAYNTRWEKLMGVSPEKIKVIYNGIEKDIFTKANLVSQTNPTVVSVARIDPYKDIISLIRTAAIVRETIPNVKFVVYGDISVPTYYQECLELCKSLDLEQTFIMAGHTNNVAAAYQSGDVIAVSSISEAFPYSVVEAMMSAKPIVSTDVGGIKEALGETGMLVQPRDTQALAKNLIRLLKNPQLREEMGRDSQERALNYFTLEKVLEQYLKSYILLSLNIKPADQKQEKPRTKPAAEWTLQEKRRIHVVRGYALADIGQYLLAIKEFRLAIQLEPSAPSTPVLLTEIAGFYNRLGGYDQVFFELEKAELLVKLHGSISTAS